MSAAPPPPDDLPARQRALDPRLSFVVQAPAGSGKTELLIQRHLRLLACVAEPEQVLAITFTRKAAAEMRNRLLRALTDAQREIPPQEPHLLRSWQLARNILQDPHRRDWELERHPSRLNIGTIDSVNSWLAGRSPLGPGATALHRVTTHPADLYRAAAEATLKLVGEPLPEARKVGALLEHLDNDAGRFIDLLAEMLPRRDQWLRLILGADRSRTDLEAPLQRITETALAAAGEGIPPDIARELPAHLAHAAAHLTATEPDHEIAAWADLERLPPPEAAALPQWRALAAALLTADGKWRKAVNKNTGFPPQSPMKASMVGLLRRCESLPDLAAALDELRHLPGDRYPDEEWEILQALMQVLPIAAAELRLEFAARGETDFAEVASDALEVLGSESEPSSLGLALDVSIQHVLVDEFQDTSLAQFQLICQLVAGWEPGDGRTLFLVGDPMQSIYRFRQADVRLFMAVQRDGIGAIRPEFLQLTANFRSDPTVVAWINQTFAGIFPRKPDLELGAVPFAASRAALPVAPNCGVRCHWLSAGGDAAAAVVSLIRDALRQWPDQNVCVLVRSRHHAVPILTALRAATIGFVAPDLEDLGSSQPAQDLLALTRALCHRGDRLAWLAVLRAPWCGLSLRDLHELAGTRDSADVWELMHDAERLQQLSEDGRCRLRATREQLARPMSRRGTMPLRDLVEGAWLSLNGPATLIEPADLDTAETFLAELEAADRGGDLIDENLLSGRLEGITGSLGGDDARVQIMTMHKAKGLEFGTVILPALERYPRAAQRSLLLWHDLRQTAGDDQPSMIFAPVPSSDDPGNQLYAWLRKIDQRKQDLEQTRVLYVACTRARNRLYLVSQLKWAPEPDGSLKSWKPKSGSLLADLWPAVSEEATAAARGFAIQIIAATDDEPPWIEPRLRRLPSTWSPPELHPAWRQSRPDEFIAASAHLDYDWASRWAMHVGAVVHRWLQVIGEQGVENFPAESLTQLRGTFRRMLEDLGTEASVLDQATGRVADALRRTIEDSRGRWILSGSHASSASELGLTIREGSRFRQAVIDRTFVTASGECWVVDYKTSAHQGAHLEEFLKAERERYRDQLQRYRQALERPGGPPVRTALYFPLLAEFTEIEPA